MTQSNPSSIVRERLDDECKDCGKSETDAEEIAPVSHGRFSLGPGWSCGECMDQIASDGGTVEDVSERTFQVLREEIRRAKENYEEEASLYDPPECPYCGHETKVGSMGGGEIKFGCYRDDCDIKEEESRYTYYSETRSVAPASRAEGRLMSLLDFAHRLALALEDSSLHMESDDDAE